MVGRRGLARYLLPPVVLGAWFSGPSPQLPPDSQRQPPPGTFDWSKLSGDEEFRRALATVLTKLPDLVLGLRRETRTTTVWTMLVNYVMLLILASLVVGAVTWLAWNGKISPEVVAFTFGSVLTAILAFARDFLPHGD